MMLGRLLVKVRPSEMLSDGVSGNPPCSVVIPLSCQPPTRAWGTPQGNVDLRKVCSHPSPSSFGNRPAISFDFRCSKAAIWIFSRFSSRLMRVISDLTF